MIDWLNVEKLRNKVKQFHSIAGKKKIEEQIPKDIENTNSLPMNRLDYDLIIYERNPFPEAAFVGFYPNNVEFLDINDFDYAKGITFEGIVESVEQSLERYIYTIRTKYGCIVAVTQERKKMGEQVKVGIQDKGLYYFDIDKNKLNHE